MYMYTHVNTVCFTCIPGCRYTFLRLANCMCMWSYTVEHAVISDRELEPCMVLWREVCVAWPRMQCQYKPNMDG